MTKFTIEDLRDIAYRGSYDDLERDLALQLLASMEQEPYGYVHKEVYEAEGSCGLSSDHEAHRDSLTHIPLYAAPQLPQPAVDEIGEIRVGRLPTMNQDEYPGLGDWWVQLRIGDDADEVLARVYGATPQEANNRAVALARRAAMLQGAEPVSQPYTLREGVAAIRSLGGIDAEKIQAERDALNEPTCWCLTCRPVTMTDMRFVVCPDCGNKRCPHANDHRNACTGSNEPGQEGSAYPAAPQQEVK